MKHSPEIQTVRKTLDSYLRERKEESLLAAVRRRVEDPLRPRTKDGRFRPNPILVSLMLLLAFSVLTFIGFSVVHQ